MQNDYSISTACSIDDKKTADEIISEIESAGFSKIELNFTISPDLLKDLTRIIFTKDIQITSVHNYCPIPKEMKNSISPDYFSISSLCEDERRKAVEYTKRTIDTASRLSARAVVLHCGRVETEYEYTKELIKLFNEGRIYSDEYKELIFRMTEERKHKSRPHLEAAIKSIKELTKYTKDNEVIIGIETRYYYREIPQFEEFEKIFDAILDSNLLYWHDVGHAQCAEDLGITHHIAFLKKYSYRMAGIHLHDTDGTCDHKLPGEGNINFKILKPYLNHKTIKVLEPHPPVDVERLRKSVDYLNKIFK